MSQSWCLIEELDENIILNKQRSTENNVLMLNLQY